MKAQDLSMQDVAPWVFGILLFCTAMFFITDFLKKKKTTTWTKFNPENKELLTIGECLDPAMEITDEADAQQYLEAYIEYQEQFKNEFTAGNTARSICLQNIGYYTGYYNLETQERVLRLFKTEHPIFGPFPETSKQ